MLKTNIFYYAIVIYLITALLGVQLGWVAFQYDELRLLQMPLALVALFFLLTSKEVVFSVPTMSCFLLIGFAIAAQFSHYDIFQLQELFSIIAVLFILAALIHSIKNIHQIHVGLTLVVLAALIPCLFIFISIVNFISGQQWFDWQFNSGSIRIYDSAIVPLFFTLIFLNNKEIPYVQYLYPVGIFLFTLAWLFDGARSALLAVMMGLIIFYLFSKANRSLILKTLFYMFAAFLVYKATVYFADKNAMTVLRTGTSLRAEMWVFVFEQWKQHPFHGVGGGFLSKIQYGYGHHIHNLYLRLLFEWGAIGLLFLIWMLYQLLGLFKDPAVSLVLKVGVIAVLVDAIFSGNMVYPISQVSCILLIAIAFSKRKIYQKSAEQITFYGAQIILGVWGLLFLYLAVVYFGQDLSCWGCGSNFGRMAPNFWEYGGTAHLSPMPKQP